MKCLLFGASGAFGTAFEKVCLANDIDFKGLNHSDIEISNSVEIKKHIERHKPDVVINSVAIIGINLCEENPDKAFAINATAVSNMAKICETRNITFVQLSTHAVFDGTKNGFYTENDFPNPINIYAASKYAGECFAKNICKKHYVIRFPTMFGLRRNKSLGFVDKMLEKIKNRQDIKAPGDKIDTLSYTDDLAHLLIFKILLNKAPYGIYHLANSGSVSFYDFICFMKITLKSDINILKVNDDDFASTGLKPLKTAMKTIKLDKIRSWDKAFIDYISNTF